VAVQWLNQALCFYQSFCLVDSEVLRNRHLRVAAKRSANTTLNLSSNLSVVVFPNPFTETATFKINDRNFENANLRIYDISGKLVQSIENINGNNIEITRGDMNSGIYFYQIHEKNKIISVGKVLVD
jgi:myo-inositol-hexaphosphate 3-phosphohydrolase